MRPLDYLTEEVRIQLLGDKSVEKLLEELWWLHLRGIRFITYEEENFPQILRCIKVACTIADLDQIENIKKKHENRAIF